MTFKDVKLLTVFKTVANETVGLKISETFVIGEYGTLMNFTNHLDTKVVPLAKNFKITFDDIIDSVDIGNNFVYNGTTYKRIAGHRQALNMETYSVETFI